MRALHRLLWLLLVGVLLCLASVAPAQQTTVTPVASVMQLMEAMVIPSSDALFNVGRQAPQNDDEWAAIRNHAIILAESGNLLMIGGRAKDEEAWMKMSQALVDAGAVALKAAEAKNVDAVLEAGNQIIDTCETCHASYLDRP